MVKVLLNTNSISSFKSVISLCRSLLIQEDIHWLLVAGNISRNKGVTVVSAVSSLEDRRAELD